MPDNLKELTALIVMSYVESNKIAGADLPSLIRLTYIALSEAGQPAVATTDVAVKPTAARIRKSITPDTLISFIDGKSYRTLKRHLTAHGFTAEGYRERYGLPTNYPMTAPTYSAIRSALATKLGLGRKSPTSGGSAPASRARAEGPVSKSQPGERAGPSARVPKAVRSMESKDVTEDRSN